MRFNVVKAWIFLFSFTFQPLYSYFVLVTKSFSIFRRIHSVTQDTSIFCSDNIEIRNGYKVQKSWKINPFETFQEISDDSILLSDLLRHLDNQVFPTISQAKRYLRRNLILKDDIPVDTTDLLHRNDPEFYLHLIARYNSTAAKFFQQQLPQYSLVSKIQVMYEDTHLAVVVKPQNMSTFPSKGDNFLSLQSALLGSLDSCETPSGSILNRAQPVHRLDKPTGGLVVIAKTHEALRVLSRQFATSKILKQYRAIVFGDISRSQTINITIDGKLASTTFYVQNITRSVIYGNISTCDVIIHTGRTHQIRRTFDSIGHPIIGDSKHWFMERPKNEYIRGNPQLLETIPKKLDVSVL